MHNFHIFCFNDTLKTIVADTAYPTDATVLFELNNLPVAQFSLENIVGWAIGEEVVVN